MTDTQLSKSREHFTGIHDEKFHASVCVLKYVLLVSVLNN